MTKVSSVMWYCLDYETEKNSLVIKIKPTRCTNFTNLFWHETLHVSDSSSVHHQEFIHCTLSNGICHTAFEQEHMLLPESCLQTCMTYTIIHCTLSNGVCHTAFEQEHMLLLESCLQTCTTYTIAECTVNKLLMMDRRTVRNM